ncbi:adenylyl-sulfate kinase [Paenibacillus massiliensis]|uniref:adenylyl-sulfate kinase n=1 Tax=Paenibacillus massiliensis TaxID=225917 RepID=UPI000360F572|nr:adenylyl-sulfate kinase [Paenibacillus massiliensis]
MIQARTPLLRRDKEQLNEHTAAVIWLTGLPGAGKSTLAIELEHILHEKGIRTALLDGDVLRQGLNRDLGFTAEARAENIRRTAEAARLLANAGVVTICALISPYEADRHQAREIIGPIPFCEVYVDCDLDICESRDPKGMYRKARSGDIPNFTGVSAPYEVPTHPELRIATGHNDVKQSIDELLSGLSALQLIRNVRLDNVHH